MCSYQEFKCSIKDKNVDVSYKVDDDGQALLVSIAAGLVGFAERQNLDKMEFAKYFTKLMFEQAGNFGEYEMEPIENEQGGRFH